MAFVPEHFLLVELRCHPHPYSSPSPRLRGQGLISFSLPLPLPAWGSQAPDKGPDGAKPVEPWGFGGPAGGTASGVLCSPREEAVLLLLVPLRMTAEFWSLICHGILRLILEVSSSQLCRHRCRWVFPLRNGVWVWLWAGLQSVLKTVHKSELDELPAGPVDSLVLSRTCFLILCELAAARQPLVIEAGLLFILRPLGGSVKHFPNCILLPGLHPCGAGILRLCVHQVTPGLVQTLPSCL